MTDRPLGARLPGRIAASTNSTRSSPSTSASAATEDSAGTEETPDRTGMLAAFARSSRSAIAAVKAASSDRSR
ncbi:hypothetical protein [Jannaschia aquimarina]|uniref:hypothetical protein n=1 Tax=Jannaschia aquimarina TaxID=935700 RepID=UPI001BAFDE94|nr:hypothetical protein [Jannaschia aquimarina]